MIERTKEEFYSMIETFSRMIHETNGTPVSVCRVKQGLDIPKLQDWLEELGNAPEGRSWSKVRVKVLEDFIMVSNLPEARGCMRLTHNQNILMNIERILEDKYLKEKNDE